MLSILLCTPAAFQNSEDPTLSRPRRSATDTNSQVVDCRPPPSCALAHALSELDVGLEPIAFVPSLGVPSIVSCTHWPEIRNAEPMHDVVRTEGAEVTQLPLRHKPQRTLA
jgi:hypothetical protein